MVCCSRIFCVEIIIFLLSFIVNLDVCWQVSRDAQGTIQPDPVTFPSGMPALIDHVHSKQLKFGLYSGTEKAHICLFIHFILIVFRN